MAACSKPSAVFNSSSSTTGDCRFSIHPNGDLLEILDDRHGRASTIVTSQIPVELWHDIIGDPTLGDAILDRLVHNAHRLQLTGESMRKKNARNQKLDDASNA
jgi:DNA replication protein DnaC